ncbi:hypothetical protein [Streptomyces longispororuber]|uniref:hypothetical protein n=1 Tax=Streptomyces longispororuber TaxID=68230 RepID=UPI002108D643|nr:hypothetical protein [Streptomyces longispororuber]MCQ4209568.1 hypothetical protein [Streptomyces longispororuber]
MSPLPDRRGSTGRRPLTSRQIGLLLGSVGSSAALLVLLVDGAVAAGAVLAVLFAAGLLLVRYVVGAGSLDSGHRDEVRLLRTRAPGMGEWRRNVRTAAGPDGALYYRAVLRPELRRLFAAALAEHHHVSLDHQPERAAELIGADLWPWLGHDTPGTGPDGDVPVPVLRALVDRLEALGVPRARTPGPRTRKEEQT